MSKPVDHAMQKDAPLKGVMRYGEQAVGKPTDRVDPWRSRNRCQPKPGRAELVWGEPYDPAPARQSWRSRMVAWFARWRAWL